MYPPTTSESSDGDSSSESSAGPSHKRCRSPVATVISSIHATRDLVPSRANLLVPRKRFRDSISPKDSVEEDIDTDVLEDIEADEENSKKAFLIRDIPHQTPTAADSSTHNTENCTSNTCKTLPWNREALSSLRSATISDHSIHHTSESQQGFFFRVICWTISQEMQVPCCYRDFICPCYKSFSSFPLQSSLHLARVDRDVMTGIDAGIDMEVDVKVDVEDEVESSDRGTMEVGVDVVAGIDIPDAMLMPDAVERLEQVEEGLQDIYDHVIEIPLQRIEDIETGQRELESRSLIAGGERASLLEQVASLERSNARLRGTMMMERARADRFRRRVRFMESELRQIRRFRYYDRMRFRRLETFAARRLGFRP
ncbi:hypothetical protein Tco_0720282 [Tanacetum coccineum]